MILNDMMHTDRNEPRQNNTVVYWPESTKTVKGHNNQAGKTHGKLCVVMCGNVSLFLVGQENLAMATDLGKWFSGLEFTFPMTTGKVKMQNTVGCLWGGKNPFKQIDLIKGSVQKYNI